MWNTNLGFVCSTAPCWQYVVTTFCVIALTLRVCHCSTVWRLFCLFRHEPFCLALLWRGTRLAQAVFMNWEREREQKTLWGKTHGQEQEEAVTDRLTYCWSCRSAGNSGLLPHPRRASGNVGAHSACPSDRHQTVLNYSDSSMGEVIYSFGSKTVVSIKIKTNLETTFTVQQTTKQNLYWKQTF